MNPNHHRHSIRLKGRNYSAFGTYFVTICTFQRECVLGHVSDNASIPSLAGESVRQSWLWLAEHYSYVDLDVWIVMPNHMHGILTIHDDIAQARPKPLGQLIGAFKSVALRQVRALIDNPEYVLWQRDYFERVIRSETELNATRQYILTNPANWANDEHYPM